MTVPTIRVLFDEMVALPEATIRSKTYKFTVAEFTKILRKYTATPDIRLLINRDKNVDMNQVIITGEYDCIDDEFGNPSITIYANFNPAQKTIRFKDIDWHQICIDLIECTGHEIIHQQQYRARNYEVAPSIFASKTTNMEKKEIQEYLGNIDEIEAYGYSIAARVFLQHNVTRLTSKHVSSTDICKSYVAAFGLRHFVTRKLLENSIKYFGYLKNN